MKEVATSQGRAVGPLPEERPAIWIVKETGRNQERGRNQETGRNQERAEHTRKKRTRAESQEK
eukprot:3077328-Heterocapsa_arctica.AAC.1